jgi:hypothetical protein
MQFACISVNICVHVHVHVHVCLHAHAFIFYICTHVRVQSLGHCVYIYYVCMYMIHAYYILIYVQIYIYIQHMNIQGWHVHLCTYIYLHNRVMLSGLFALGFAFWEFRVYILQACVCVCVCVYTCVWGCEVCVCLCVFIYGSVLLCMLQICGNISISWYHGFFCFPLFDSAVAEFRVCVLSTCVCVCIHTRVCVCPHTHVYTVCTCGGMCACKCMYWSTHTHQGTHPCVCMYVCAPCPPRHDPPLTPPMQQDGWTPLHASAQNGHTDTVLALLQAGATVDAKTEKVRGALLSECMCVCFRIRV